MTRSAKRSIDVCLANGDPTTKGDATLHAPLKRARYVCLYGNGQAIHRGDESCRDRLVASALMASTDDLDAALRDALPKDIDAAMMWLVGNAPALDRLCHALTTATGGPLFFSTGSLLYSAAQRGHPTAVRVLVDLCDESDVASALTMAIDSDDAPALKVIVETCADDAAVPIDTYRRLVHDAMIEAVDAGSAAIAGYLVTACDDATLASALDRCCADHNDANDIRVFAVLWDNAGLCAHAYAATLDPCPALDYLDALIAHGEPCAGACLARVDDDGDDPSCRDAQLFVCKNDDHGVRNHILTNDGSSNHPDDGGDGQCPEDDLSDNLYDTNQFISIDEYWP